MAFSFGATQPAQASSFSFGQPAAGAAPTGTTGFGSLPTTVSSTPAFGQTSTAPFSFPSIGTTTSTAPAPTFGGSTFSFNNPTSSAFNQTSLFNKPATQSQPPKFGPNFTSTSLFQTPQQQQQQLQQQQQQQGPPPVTTLFCPKIYNDERDNIIGLFNSLQAFWGMGKAYYSAFHQPHEFNQADQFNRFKTICYSEVQTEDKDNEQKVFFLVRFTDESQLKTSLLTYEQSFKQLLGTNYTMKLELKNTLPDNKVIISFTVVENATGKTIPEAQLRTFFGQPNSKQQLNQIFGGNFIEVLFTSISKQELDAYLSVPPKGIDERIWNQVKLENPDPNRFTPLPLIGFEALNNRFKMQEKEINQQKGSLKQIIDNATALESDISQFKAKFEECRRRHSYLSYQVLKKMTAQEVQRKRTLPIQADEDKLRAKLESIQSELSVPTKFQGCLNELMSQLRQMQCQSQLGNTLSTTDHSVFNEYRQFLSEQNEGIMKLVNILTKDIDDINRLSKK